MSKLKTRFKAPWDLLLITMTIVIVALLIVVGFVASCKLSAWGGRKISAWLISGGLKINL